MRFKPAAKIALLAALCFTAQKFSLKKTEGFSLPAISSNRPHTSAYETRALTLEEENVVQAALSQPYAYFGCGGQAYAFFSEDGNYALKFFKQRLFRPPHLLNALPLPPFLHRYREKRRFARSDKLRRDFSSYRIAFDELQEETGMVYTHLNKTTHLPASIKITDRFGSTYSINPNQYDFVLQKRAERVYDRIDKAKDAGEAKEIFTALFSLIKTRAQKGYRDRDPNVRTNCGFIGEKAVKIDVGRFVPEPKMKEKEVWEAELKKIVDPFYKWILNTHPDYASVFRQALDETIN